MLLFSLQKKVREKYYGTEILPSKNNIHMTENIFPDFTRSIPRPLKEQRLNQKGLVIWFTGLSGSGKSTLTFALESIETQGLFSNHYLSRLFPIGRGYKEDITQRAQWGTENHRGNVE